MSDRNPFDYINLHPILREEMEARDEELRRNAEK